MFFYLSSSTYLYELPHTDSVTGMSPQLIVWAPTREKAIERMKRALNDTIITGQLPLLFSGVHDHPAAIFDSVVMLCILIKSPVIFVRGCFYLGFVRKLRCKRS